MDVTSDLEPAQLAVLLGGRDLRAYPALLSTEATAMAWAREGARSGSLVVADYQAAPRGRGGLPWTVRQGIGLGFTLIVRPDLPPEREGWPYVAALLALHDVLGLDGARLSWPDAVLASEDEKPLARLGVYVELAAARTEWVTATVQVEDVTPPRGPLLAMLVEAMERRLAEPSDVVLADYVPLCATLGRHLRARLLPVGPGGPEVTGRAVDVLADGSLVLLTDRGNRVAVPPQNLGFLEPPAEPAKPPDDLLGFQA